MTVHHNLLSLAGLLRQRYVRPTPFNLFTILRSAGDEVRLHSRFLAALLDPLRHSLGPTPLRGFLAQCAIEDFVLEDVRVECERWNMDILITNARRQAVVIENKIHAGDQPDQLMRYHRQLRAAGYRPVHVRYLTLDGRDPQADSLGDLQALEAEAGSYAALDYQGDVMPWLSTCMGHAALDPPLRESLLQYRQVIQQLTGNDMDSQHLATLADTLLQGDNLKAAHDIRLAYDEALIRLQVRLWRALRDRIEAVYPEMAGHPHGDSWRDADLEGLCRAYIHRQRGNKGYGLYYRVPGHVEDICVGLEVEHAIYVGVYCERAHHPETYRAICRRLDEAEHGGARNDYWPSFAYSPEPLPLKTPTAEQLARLGDPEYFQYLVSTMTDELARLWTLLGD
ncbi:PDDEXK-like family protein [Halomonas koreensis]|uniref:PD-(D/E)XK nuclease family protein n=1 Tax=Halomonas koreensis TaxID=245385 RepID=A0ABU1G492_9GAMM|nr:PD-(D/E)XK nuclease family protein [Halomonas koreensis]MDR5867776.1 PD-(D/E)XK nuclease family protein [Halomonas koreensis]